MSIYERIALWGAIICLIAAALFGNLRTNTLFRLSDNIIDGCATMTKNVLILQDATIMLLNKEGTREMTDAIEKDEMRKEQEGNSEWRGGVL